MSTKLWRYLYDVIMTLSLGNKTEIILHQITILHILCSFNSFIPQYKLCTTSCEENINTIGVTSYRSIILTSLCETSVVGNLMASLQCERAPGWRTTVQQNSFQIESTVGTTAASWDLLEDARLDYEGMPNTQQQIVNTLRTSRRICK